MQSSHFAIPTTPFPILPLRKGVIFPGSVATLPVGRRRSLELVRTLQIDDVIGIVAQRDGEQESPSAEDLERIGTVARIQQIKRRGGYVQLTVEGLRRFRIDEIVESEPFWRVAGAAIEEQNADTETAHLLAQTLYNEYRRLADHTEQPIPTQATQEPGRFADLLAATLQISSEEEQQLLELLDVEERLRVVALHAGQAKTRSSVKKSIEDEIKQGFSKHQREAILREQLRAIKKELGEESSDEVQKLRERLSAAALPKDAQQAVDRELQRMESMNPNQAEYGILQKYLEWMADLPWDKRATVVDDLHAVEDQLNADHFGLEEVKRHILEHFAVLQRAGNKRGTILCLSGPPGVGKTSLGRSIAESTGRPFVRIALGGVRDEAEIRGHRRTYVGALPGRIISGLKQAGVKNPVFLLDEIDKLGRGWMGDPQAALLEVLDPEQNNTFTDHYIEQSFDLSEVMFICTANDLSALSPPLRDRLQVIELSGYTAQEKTHIAQEHLLPKQREEHNLDEDTFVLQPKALQTLIQEYTREAGVRQLNRELQKLCRGITLSMMKRTDQKQEVDEFPLDIDVVKLREYLGKARYFDEVKERTSVPGVATGLAWTPTGGDILFIETTAMQGKGHLELTGQLGDVMKESARAALTYVRSHAEELQVDPSFIEKLDLHIHVPAGGIPKDGPSAGITIFTALTSLLTGRKIRPDTAMTGECTLRGRVLPVGGIKAKVLAAHRAGLHRVILPKRNAPDLDDVPQEIRDTMEFILAQDMHDVLLAALEPLPTLAHVPPMTPPEPPKTDLTA